MFLRSPSAVSRVIVSWLLMKSRIPRMVSSAGWSDTGALARKFLKNVVASFVTSSTSIVSMVEVVRNALKSTSRGLENVIGLELIAGFMGITEGSVLSSNGSRMSRRPAGRDGLAWALLPLRDGRCQNMIQTPMRPVADPHQLLVPSPYLPDSTVAVGRALAEAKMPSAIFDPLMSPP